MKLIELIAKCSNDYSKEEQAFELATGLKFVGEDGRCDYEQAFQQIRLPTVSVIIPAFNSHDTLGLLLDSLDLQTFLDYSPKGMEVVIVDDGSEDGNFTTFTNVSMGYRYSLTLIRLRQNLGRSKARNFGFLQSKNELLLLVDSDVVVPPCLVVAHALRHAFYEKLLLVSLREHIHLYDPIASHEFIRQHPNSLKPDHKRDWRYFAEHRDNGTKVILRNVSGTKNWKALGFGNRYFAKTLADMVVGVCLSVRREYYEFVGGIWHGFTGWGREDVFFGAMLIAAGCYIVPCLSAVYHIRHAPRSGSLARRNEEWMSNASLYNELLDRDFECLVEEGQLSLEKLRSSKEICELHILPPAT